MKKSYKSALLNYLACFSMTKRERARKERYFKKKEKEIEKVVKAKRKDLTTKEKRQQDILFYGKPITKKLKENYKNYV